MMRSLGLQQATRLSFTAVGEVMPKALMGLAISVMMVCTQALAKETVNETLDADPKGFVEIKHVSGEAKIIGWDKAQVKVEGELGDRTEEFIFERDGKSIVIQVKVKNSKSWWSHNNGGNGDDLTIYLPNGSRIDYSSPNASVRVESVFGGADIEVVNGSVRAEDIKGKIRLNSVNGDIRGNKLAGELVLDTVNGDVNAEQTQGDEIRASTVNGNIKVRSTASEAFAETVNGDIEFLLQRVEELRTNTVNGRIEMEMTLAEGAKVQASSVGGSIELAFQEGVQARFNLQSHAGGSIKNRITNQKAKKPKYGPSSNLAFTTGDANATVEASTVSGRIEVKVK